LRNTDWITKLKRGENFAGVISTQSRDNGANPIRRRLST
jgi:hypothetical protein